LIVNISKTVKLEHYVSIKA